MKEKRPLAELDSVMKLVTEAEKELSGKGRVLLRYSGTEPKIRLLIEGRESEMIDKQADRIADAIQTAIGAVSKPAVIPNEVRDLTKLLDHAYILCRMLSSVGSFAPLRMTAFYFMKLDNVIEALLFSAQKPLSIHEITAAIKAAEGDPASERLTSSRA